MDDVFMTTAEASRFLRYSPITLEKYRVSGKGPRFIQHHKKVVYAKSDLIAFMNAGRKDSTSAPAIAAA
jgi:hypothetical protein